ncbi:hypothetical protein [Deinococcus peraridilitoris]|uniref:hypothetical protein n=1 Tax=Deinococcus peraridilitoris TaxID=432329 RepID=UPI00059E982C|nr:hypothetical protein [Deinococcus peraridilitoris]
MRDGVRERFEFFVRAGELQLTLLQTVNQVHVLLSDGETTNNCLENHSLTFPPGVLRGHRQEIPTHFARHHHGQYRVRRSVTCGIDEHRIMGFHCLLQRSVMRFLTQMMMAELHAFHPVGASMLEVRQINISSGCFQGLDGRRSEFLRFTGRAYSFCIHSKGFEAQYPTTWFG